jgi:hypothetical protein
MSDAQHDPEAVLFVEEREPQPVLSIRTNVAVSELAEAQGESLGELWRSMQARGFASVGWIDANQEPDRSSWPAPTEWRTELVQPIASIGGNPP